MPCVSALTNRDGSPSVLPPQPAIVTDRVRHVGDTVAMVVAETAAAARDAAELIAVEYEPLPAVVETGARARPGPAAGVGRGAGQSVLRLGDRRPGGGRARGRRSARTASSLTLVNNRIVVNSMEPRGAIGEYDPGEDAYTLWSSTQGSHFVRNLLAEQRVQDAGEPHPRRDAAMSAAGSA